MITNAHGNLLTDPVEALVNTVNTKGVMGKGIALQFKKAFPQMFKDYAAAAKRGEITLGKMSIWQSQTFDNPKFIINFPTKGHWKSPSRVSDIKSGLKDLVRVVHELKIESIAVPPLGCGNGGLDWSEVEPLIRAAFSELPEVEVHLYAPAGAPEASAMPNNTQRPRMTAGRAALLGILERYSAQSLSEPSLIETQKLMYFMQVLGEPLNLRFEAHHYGPYADNLRHVLSTIEGHFLTGYGDASSKISEADTLKPLAAAYEQVENELHRHPETKTRMNQVLDLAQGYESAYGLELLASVHWTATEIPSSSTDEEIASHLAQWSPRKSRMFTTRHVQSALSTLRSHDLLKK